VSGGVSIIEGKKMFWKRKTATEPQGLVNDEKKLAAQNNSPHVNNPTISANVRKFHDQPKRETKV